MAFLSENMYINHVEDKNQKSLNESLLELKQKDLYNRRVPSSTFLIPESKEERGSPLSAESSNPVSINLSLHRMSSFASASMALKEMESYPNSASSSPRYMATFQDSVAFLRPSQSLDRLQREFKETLLYGSPKSSTRSDTSTDSYVEEFETYEYTDYDCSNCDHCTCELNTIERMNSLEHQVHCKTLVDPYFRALFIMSKFVQCNNCDYPFAVIVGREDEATFDVFSYPKATI